MIYCRRIALLLSCGLLMVAAFGGCDGNGISQRVETISSADAVALIRNREGELSFAILDVRTPTEFADGYIVGATNIDFYDPEFAVSLDALTREHTYLVYCKSGGRSGRTVEIMRDMGFQEVYDLEGGYSTFSQLNDTEIILSGDD